MQQTFGGSSVDSRLFLGLLQVVDLPWVVDLLQGFYRQQSRQDLRQIFYRLEVSRRQEPSKNLLQIVDFLQIFYNVFYIWNTIYRYSKIEGLLQDSQKQKTFCKCSCRRLSVDLLKIDPMYVSYRKKTFSKFSIDSRLSTSILYMGDLLYFFYRKRTICRSSIDIRYFQNFCRYNIFCGPSLDRRPSVGLLQIVDLL